MAWIDQMNERAALMRRMLETIDGMSKIPEGDTGSEDLQTAAVNCMGCQESEACAEWLDEHPEGAGKAPEICPNRNLFSDWLDS